MNQPRPQKKFLLLLIPFIGYFIFYLILYIIISSRRAVLPSSFIEWEAWITVCIFLFVLPEGLILLISIILRAFALRIGNDPRLDLEPETEWSKRQLRWFRRFLRAFSLLSYPHLTIFAPMLVVVGVFAPCLSILQSLLGAANHSDYHAWIILALLWILNGLAVIPIIRIWKWFMEADYSPPDEISTDE